ncbi:MAG: glycyl radical protein [Salinivirgaceae bacterium]|nr:glycyl radical protein [Salinivirgaceae bacterium]
MRTRIDTLRTQSLETRYSISDERAMLMTEYYKSIEGKQISVPVARAESFRYLMSRKKIYIGDQELIVGERGPEPKATPTYPEVSLHSIEDLEILHNRSKVSFSSTEQVRQNYATIITPFWEGKTVRDHIFSNMTPQWLDAYNAGVFTEFQEQRAPGHTVAGTKIWHMGMADLKKHISVVRNRLNASLNSNNTEKLEELDAMEIVADTIIMYANRHADELQRQLSVENDSIRQGELEKMMAICRRVPENAPETFHEALQHYWFIHVGVITELNPWDSFNPGRLDQHLFPFWKREIEQGSLTVEDSKELLEAFWIKFNNHPSPPKIGVTAKESNTYTDFSLINLGGLTPDGHDAVNDLTFLLLDVIEEMRILQPSSMVQISEKNPDSFILRALKIAKTGFGQPSFFNTDTIVQQLERQGKTTVDARNGGCSGCVETGAFGTERYILTGYFNLNKILELTLHNGVDAPTGKTIGLQTGKLTDFETFEDFYTAFERQLHYFIDIKIVGNNFIEKQWATSMPAPFLSLIIDDCIENAQDYNAGGARYNTSYIQGVGLGSIANNFASIKKYLFDDKSVTKENLLLALASNFDGHEALRHRFIYETPKWGNNDNEADQHAVAVFNSFFNAVDNRETALGGRFRINMLPTTSHVYFGSKLGAMPDGRKAKMPLSEGISPVQGTDIYGPTSVILSAAKIDHIRTGGTLLNQKFNPSFFANEKNMRNLTALIRSYFAMNGHHIQFNVVEAETLRKAKLNPENYRDLIVRVAGYSDYFNDLTQELQDEIIRRTEHETV